MPPVRYVLTDFTESNLAAWRAHPRLKPYFEAGMLDLARFDAERDTELRLERSGVVLSPSSGQNPMLFVANYVFDSLSHDVFRVRKGVLEEGLATLRLVKREDARDQEMLEHVDVTYDYRPVENAATYYPDEPLAGRILADYARRLGDTAFTFPLGGMRCLQHLAAIAGGRLCVLTADKGHAREVDLLGLADPGLARHRGGVSMMVNYHALGELLKYRGGFMLAQVNRAASLEICVLALVGGAPLPQTRLGFEEAMERVGPTDIYRLLEHMVFEKMDLDQLLSVMRMTAWDPITFISLARDLHRCAGDAYVEQVARLRQALQKVWALYFPLADGKDVAFELGFVYYAMRRYREAMSFYKRSVEMYGEHHVTLFNMGLCEFQQGRLEEARDLFDRALARDASYAPARDWRMRISGELATAAAAEDSASPVVVRVADADEGVGSPRVA
jgi:tetratricopeptide (TPR) repeat protein